MKDRTDLIYGVNPVVECIRARRRRVHEIFLVRGGREGSPRDRIVDLAARAGIQVRVVDPSWMSGRFQAREDQGVAASVEPYPYVQLGDLLGTHGDGVAPLLVALDQVQDPRNLGAIARSAVAFGASGMIIHRDRSASVTPAAVKASAGVVEHLEVAMVTNLARAIATARDSGLAIVGLEGGAAASLFDVDLAVPTVIVAGGEDSGLRRLTREGCDSLASIPIDRKCQSLNAATAVAVALAEASRQRAAARGGGRR